MSQNLQKQAIAINSIIQTKEVRYGINKRDAAATDEGGRVEVL